MTESLQPPHALRKPLALDDLGVPYGEGRPCWVEVYGDSTLIPVVLRRDTFAFYAYGFTADERLVHLYYIKERYNECWRCWALKPTDEEKSAARWDN